jgi:CRP/FNR family transcriptional regulator, cyclic AMP receptor protein
MKPADIDFRAFAQSVGTIVHHHAGNEIYREGDEADFMYVILGGSVALEARGREVGTLGPSEAMGITSLIDKLPRPNTARAKLDCELVMIDADKFRFMMEEVPNFVWFVMTQMTRRLRALNEAI